MKKNWHNAWIFDKKLFTKVFGLPLAGVATAFSLVTYPTHAFDYEMVQDAPEYAKTVVVSTNSEYQFPLQSTLGMSQGFRGSLHPGLDLRASKGTKILAMAEGTVIEVKEMLIGYGHFVRIAHQGTISTLYAHLDKVMVKPGQKVAKGENIGTVGLTGWSTGPHLHFEVYDGNKAVDPMGFIGSKTLDSRR